MISIEDNIKTEVFNKYLEIKLDITQNIDQVFNRFNYYTKKYRGNRLTDINVSLLEKPNNVKEVQIFVRHKNTYIKECINYNSKGIINIERKTNIYD